MKKQPRRNRVGLAIEACESRQLLSAVALATPQVEAATDLRTWQSYGTFNLSDISGGRMTMLTSGQISLTLTNGYGSVASDFHSFIDFGAVHDRGLDLLGGSNMPLVTIRAPVLDPFVPPLQAPQEAVDDGSLFTSPNSPLPSPVADPVAPPASPLAPPPSSALPQSPAPLGDPAHPAADQKVHTVSESHQIWLPVTFSPIEQHRLSVSSGEPNPAEVAARDTHARLALEPTRVGGQVVCMLDEAIPAVAGRPVEAEASAAAQSEGGDHDSLNGATRRGKPVAEPIVPATLRSIRDAAILDWDVPRRATRDGLIAAAMPGDREEADLVPALVEETQVWQAAAQFFDENKDLVGAVLAAVAMQSLWFYDRGRAEETAPPLKLARKPLTTRRVSNR